jgi:hypothetical protein
MKLSLSILGGKKERQDETQFTNLGGKKGKDRMKLSLSTKIDGFLSFRVFSQHPLNANVLFCRFFLFLISLHPVYDQTQGSGAVFTSLYGITLLERSTKF